MGLIRAIRDKLAGVDEVVPVLIFFEIVYLAIGQLIIWAFLPVDKPYVAIGFAIGVGFAMLSSIQNSMILGRALARGKKKAASAGMVIFMLMRIAGISILVVLALKYKFCSPVALLIGVLAIQAGVYFEPMVRKRRERRQAMLRQEQHTQAEEESTPGKLSSVEWSKSTNQGTQNDTEEYISNNRRSDETEKELQKNLQKDAQGAEGNRVG